MAGSRRFGHTNDISALFGESSEANEYIMGLVWLALTFGIIFLLWIIIILFLCCLGSKRVGFLSGQPFARKHYYYASLESNKTGGLVSGSSSHNLGQSATDDDIKPPTKNDVASFEQSMTTNPYEIKDGVSESPKNHVTSPNSSHNNSSYHRRMTSSGLSSQHNPRSNTDHKKDPTFCGIDRIKWVRSIFILSNVIFIVFSWLFVTRGLTNAQNTVDTMNQSAASISNLTGEGARVLQNFTDEFNRTSNAVITTLINELSTKTELCPNDPSLSSSTIVQKLGEVSSILVLRLERLQELDSIFNINSFIRSLNRNSQQANSVYESTNNINLTDWQSLVAIIPGTIVSLLLIVATIMAWNSDHQINQSNPTERKNLEKSRGPTYLRCMIVWIIVPLFVMIVGVSIVTCVTVVVAAGANADFCYPPQYSNDPNVVLPPIMMQQVQNDGTNTFVVNNNGQLVTTPLNAPDVATLQVLLNNGYEIDSEEYFIVAFYIAQCTKANPFDFMLEYVPLLVSLSFSFMAFG
jgi:antitoxin component of MazEF toxin-antitoxin module